MQNSETRRIDWIDALRGLAMFFVIWGHTFPTNKWGIRKYIYSFHLPLFFFISGLNFRDSDRLSFKEFLKKRIKSLIIPYIIINIVCYLIMLILFNLHVIESFSYWKDFVGIFYSHSEVFIQPSGPSWFLITLFLTEMIFFFLKKNSTSDFNLGISVSICGLISYVNSISGYQQFLPLHLDTVFMGVVFYYAGYLFLKNMYRIKQVFNTKLKRFIFGLSFGMIGFAAQYFNRRVSMHANLYGSITLFLIGSIFTIVALVFFVTLFIKKSYMFKTIGKNTIFYLGYHNIIILILLENCPRLLNSNIMVFAIATILTILLLPISLLVKKYCPILIGKFR